MCIRGSSAVGPRASRKSNTTSLSQGSLQAASACSNTHLVCALTATTCYCSVLHTSMTLHDDHMARPEQHRQECCRRLVHAHLGSGAAEDAKQRLLADCTRSCSPAGGVLLTRAQGLR